jgi:hypothetical protein
MCKTIKEHHALEPQLTELWTRVHIQVKVKCNAIA